MSCRNPRVRQQACSYAGGCLQSVVQDEMVRTSAVRGHYQATQPLITGGRKAVCACPRRVSEKTPSRDCMKSPQELLKEGSVSIRNEVKKAYLVTGKLKISPLSATLTPFHTVSLGNTVNRGRR